MKSWQNHKLLLIFLLIFLLKGSLYATVLTPPNFAEFPDEVGHFSYLHTLSHTHQLPIMHHTPFYQNEHTLFLTNYFNPQTPLSPTPLTHQTVSCANPPQTEVPLYNLVAGCQNWITQHPPLYYLLMLPFFNLATVLFNTLPAMLIFLRLISLFLFGSAFIFFFYKTLKLLQKSNTFILLALSFVVFSPMLQYYFAGLTNDSLLFLLSLASLHYLLRFQQTHQQKHLFLFALTAALSLLTKTTSLLILIPYLLYTLYLLIHHRKETNLRASIHTLFLTFALLTGPLFLHNLRTYGTPLITYDPILPSSLPTSLPQFLNTGYPLLLARLWILDIGMARPLGPTPLQYALQLILFILLFFSAPVQKHKKTILLTLGGLILFLIPLTTVFPQAIKAWLSLLFLALLTCLFFATHKATSSLTPHKTILRFFLATLLIVYAEYALMHYLAYNTFGDFYGTHARYYFILFFPFTYLKTLLLTKLPLLPYLQKRLPLLLLPLLLVNEIAAIVHILTSWHS